MNDRNVASGKPMCYLSKFHPSFPENPSGRDYPFNIGDTAYLYRTKNGERDGESVIVRSGLMMHKGAEEESKYNPSVQDAMVYEVEYSDGIFATSIDKLFHKQIPPRTAVA
jgi:hypothetical protein